MSMLKQKFYLETYRLHKRGAVREPHLLHLTAEDAEETNNRVKDKTIIRRSFVASGLRLPRVILLHWGARR